MVNLHTGHRLQRLWRSLRTDTRTARRLLATATAQPSLSWLHGPLREHLRPKSPANRNWQLSGHELHHQRWLLQRRRSRSDESLLQFGD